LDFEEKEKERERKKKKRSVVRRNREGECE
jgi:hypothetical protein